MMRGRANRNPDRRLESWRAVRVPAAIVTLATLAGIWLFEATPHGLGIASDSVAYLGGAANILAGQGFSRLSGGGTVEPLTHFPPFYSLVLAGLGRLGVDLAGGTRGLNAALMGLLVCGVALAGSRIGMSPIAILVAGAFAAASPILFELSGWALSDPLFLVLGLTGLLVLERGLKSPSPRVLLLSGALVGLAYLTRYVGVSLVLTGMIRILLLPAIPSREKRLALMLFLAGSLTPVAIWFGRNWLLTGTFTNRTFAWHPLTTTKWKSPLQLLWSWILPLKFTWLALEITLAAVGLGAVVWTWRIRRRLGASGIQVVEFARRGGLAAGLAVFAVVYTLGVLASLLWVDAAIPVDQRISAPTYLAVLILAVSSADRLWRRAGERGRAGLIAAAIIILAGYAGRTWGLTQEYRRDGQGFASEGWRRSGAIAAVRRLPASLLLYTNNPEAVYFFTGRGAYGLPQPFDSVTGRPMAGFTGRLEAVGATLTSSGGAVIVFQSPGSEEEIRTLAPLLDGLLLYYEGLDGTVRVSPGDHG